MNIGYIWMVEFEDSKQLKSYTGQAVSLLLPSGGGYGEFRMLTHSTLDFKEGDRVEVAFTNIIDPQSRTDVAFSGIVMATPSYIDSSRTCIDIKAPPLLQTDQNSNKHFVPLSAAGTDPDAEQIGPPSEPIRARHFAGIKSMADELMRHSMDRYLSDGIWFEVDVTLTVDITMPRRVDKAMRLLELLFELERQASPSGRSMTADVLLGDAVPHLPHIDTFAGISETIIQNLRLGLNERQLDAFDAARQAPGGVSLVVGPRGTGKTQFVIGRWAQAFGHLRLSETAASPSMLQAAHPKVTSARQYDTHQHLPFTKTHRDGCLILVLSSLNENADGLTKMLFKSLSHTKENKFAVVSRLYSRKTDMDIARHDAYKPPKNLSTAHQELLHEADQVVKAHIDAGKSTADLFVATSAANSTHSSYVGLDDPGKGARFAGRPMPERRVKKAIIKFSLGIGYIVAAGLDMDPEFENQSHIQDLIRSPLGKYRGTYHWARHRELHARYIRMLSSGQINDDDDTFYTEFISETKRLRAFVLRHADAVVATVGHIGSTACYPFIRPHIIFMDETGVPTEAEIAQVFSLFPSAKRRVFVGDPKQIGPQDESPDSFNPFNRQNKYQFLKRLPETGLPITVLNVQHRTLAEIGKLAATVCGDSTNDLQHAHSDDNVPEAVKFRAATEVVLEVDHCSNNVALVNVSFDSMESEPLKDTRTENDYTEGITTEIIG